MKRTVTPLLVFFVMPCVAGYLDAPAPDYIESMATLRTGHDFLAIARAVASVPEKDEFETEQSYSSKVAAVLDKPAYGQVRPSDRLVYVAKLGSDRNSEDGMRYEYAAQTQSIKLCNSNLSILKIPQFGDATSIKLRSVREGKGSYVGSNSFGVKASVTKSQTSVLEIAIPQKILGSRCYGAMELPADEARSATRDASFAMVGHIVPPYIHHRQMYLSPTLKYPYEQVITYVSIVFQVEEVLAFTPSGHVFYRSSFKE